MIALRTEERLQDDLILNTVLTSSKLSGLNEVNAAILGSFTPSLSVNSGFGPDKATFAIRGFFQEAFT